MNPRNVNPQSCYPFTIINGEYVERVHTAALQGRAQFRADSGLEPDADQARAITLEALKFVATVNEVIIEQRELLGKREAP